MKIDKHLPALPLTRNQSYFVSCWFNMVHEHSLDSYRVRAMNPQNILREMLKIYEIGKSDERAAVRVEAHGILSRDLVLREAPFEDSAKRLITLLSEKGLLAASKEEGPAVSMLRYFVSELHHQIKAHYVTRCLSMLGQVLTANQIAPPLSSSVIEQGGAIPPTAPSDPDRFVEILCLTSHLLSTLIDNGASIESLYALYSEILAPRKPKNSSLFSRRYALTSALLTQAATEHLVVLALDNVTAPEKFPTEIGGVTFATAAPFSPMPNDLSSGGTRARKFLTPGKRRLFASVNVMAQDPRAAGAEAAESLNNILNLVRFEYERDRITLSDIFAFIDHSKPNRGPRAFNLPAVVPNPSSQIDGDGLSAFVKSVDELVLRGRFQDEGQDRVNSAFRLYRTGLDTSVLENKLVNWWTAIEYLVRGSNGQGGSIGKSVESMLTPVLSRTYLAKHLYAFRAALLEMGIVFTDPTSQETLALKSMSADQLYLLFKRNDFQAQVLPLISSQTFMHEQFESFLIDLGDPKKLYLRNAVHEQRLKWQLQRLWRARCDIVHSAERTVSAALLCANLEYYLKLTLMSLLKDLRDIPTLSGPKEFFDRQAFVYEALQKDLKSGSDTELLRNLAA